MPRPKGAKSKTTEFLQTPEGLKAFEDFKAKNYSEKGKEDKPIKNVSVSASTSSNSTKLEGELPDVGTKTEDKKETGTGTGAKPQTEIPVSNPADSAKSLTSVVCLVADIILMRQGRELVSDMERETYAKEITPCVAKYQHLLKYIVELQAIGATATFAYVLAHKPVVDEKKHNEWKGNKKDETKSS